VIQYDFGKQVLATFDHRHAPRPPSSSLLEGVQVLEQERVAGRRPWDEYFRQGLEQRGLNRPDVSTDVVLDKAGEPIAHPPYLGQLPRTFHGPIASANCVQGDFRKRDKLRQLYKIKAVEMEGSGIADASWEYEKAGYLIVRGICDYCDARNKETQTDAWKPIPFNSLCLFTIEQSCGGNVLGLGEAGATGFRFLGTSFPFLVPAQLRTSGQTHQPIG
jgi:nucleoside phosphorylase